MRLLSICLAATLIAAVVGACRGSTSSSGNASLPHETLWSVDPGGHLERFDASSGAATASLGGPSVSSLALLDGGSRLWVVATDGRLFPVEAATNTFGQPVDVGAADDALLVSGNGGQDWIVDAQHGRVFLFDGLTGVVGAPISVTMPRDNVTAVAGAGSLWVSNFQTGSVTRLSPGKTLQATTIPLRPPLASNAQSGGAQDISLAFGDGELWLTLDGQTPNTGPGGTDSVVTRVDPATNRPGRLVNLGEESEPDVKIGFGAVWVFGAEGSAQVIDPHTGSVSRTLLFSRDAANNEGEDITVAPSGHYWWATDEIADSVVRINPRTFKISLVHLPSGLASEEAPPIALAAGTSELWLSVSPNDGDDTVSFVIDSATGHWQQKGTVLGDEFLIQPNTISA